MSEAERRRIFGPIRPMHTHPLTGPARSTPAGHARVRIAIALACLWAVAMAILALMIWS